MQNIEIKNLTFSYSKNTPFEKKALEDINLVIEEGEFVGIVGHTGSGKSTFIQHINGLIKPQEGSVQVYDITLINKKRPKPDLRKLRGTVGMVFQYPEYQLFDDTVEKDVAYGPKNLKLSKEEISLRVRESIELVGLNFDDIRNRSPFELSGGQKRRVAIAGVLAMRPKVLILDEPTAGLDPKGKEQILSLICRLKESYTPTIIVISHDIDEIVRYASRLVVFSQSKIAYDIPVSELFAHEQELKNIGLDVPMAYKISQDLKKQGIELNGDIFTALDLERAIVKYYNSQNKLQLDYDKLPKTELSENKSRTNSNPQNNNNLSDIFGQEVSK